MSPPPRPVSRLRRPPRRTTAFGGWKETEYCALDLETTGLDPARDRVVSFGAVPVVGGRVVTSSSLYSLVNPMTAVGREAVVVHSLRACDLDRAPRLEECLDQLLEMLSGRVLVAHSAWVETGFLREALRRRGRRFPLPVIDTAVLAQRTLSLPRVRDGYDVSLEYATAAAGLPAHTPHHALGDAVTTAQLFIALAARRSQREYCTASTLLRLSRREPRTPAWLDPTAP